MKYAFLLFCFLIQGISGPDLQAAAGHGPGKIHVTVQKRVAVAGSDRFTVVKEKQQWDPAQTAIIICDMWNQHWCKGATARVKELAPHINEVLNIARKEGVLIVHAPSDCMKYYKDYPGRKLAEKYAVAGAEAPDGNAPIASEKNAVWPIDQSDGGCNDTPRCKEGSVWKKEIDLIDIKKGDVISDSGSELIGLFRDRGIKRVILMGVHTNMCIINRSFGMRNMTRYGIQVALMRDLTDAMYDSRQKPYVNHFQGVALMIDYIEKYIGPTMVSTDFTGKPPFRFTGDTRP